MKTAQDSLVGSALAKGQMVSVVLWRWVRGFFVCEACGIPAHRKCTFVERPGDGLHDQWQLCADCRKLYIEPLQKLLYPTSPNTKMSNERENVK
jgi:hypothetical protein